MQELSSWFQCNREPNRHQLNANEWDASQNWRFLQNIEKKNKKKGQRGQWQKTTSVIKRERIWVTEVILYRRITKLFKTELKFYMKAILYGRITKLFYVLNGKITKLFKTELQKKISFEEKCRKNEINDQTLEKLWKRWHI